MIDPPGTGADDLVVYDLSDWSPEQRRALGRSLTGEGVAHHWDRDPGAPAPDAAAVPVSPPEGADQLLVPEAHGDLVEELIDEIDHPEALEPQDDDGDDRGGEVLSELYVASDVLLAAPTNLSAGDEIREAAAAAAALAAPYGLDDVVWAEVRARAASVEHALVNGDEEDVVVAARALREAVRPLV